MAGLVTESNRGIQGSITIAITIRVAPRLRSTRELLDRVADDDKMLASFIRAPAIAHIDDISPHLPMIPMPFGSMTGPGSCLDGYTGTCGRNAWTRLSACP